MFIGEYQHNLDEKGRLAVPAKFRAKLQRGAVVTKGLDNCLFLYPRKEWEDIAKKLSALPISQKGARAFARMMLGGAFELDIDKQGRVTLPQPLRDFAKIKGKTIIAGLYSRLEIWDRSSWDEYRKKTEKDSSDIAEQLGDMGV